MPYHTIPCPSGEYAYFEPCFSTAWLQPHQAHTFSSGLFSKFDSASVSPAISHQPSTFTLHQR
jgi:hypothetical protein